MQVFGDRGGGAARGFTDAAAQARVQPSGFTHSVLKLLHPIPAGHTGHRQEGSGHYKSLFGNVVVDPKQ